MTGAKAGRAGMARRLWKAPALLLSITITFWAGNSIVGRAVRDTIPPFTLAAFRWSGAALLLLPFALPHMRQDWPLLRASWPIVLLLGLLGVAAFNGLLYTALHHTTATNGLLIQSSIPAIILLIEALLLRRRPGWLRVSAVALSIAGVAVIISKGSLTTLLHIGLGRGDLLVLAASASWAVYTLLLSRRPALHPLSFLLATFVVGIAAMAPLAAHELATGQRIVWSPGAVGAIVYVAIFPSLIAYVCYTRAVELAGPGLAGQYINAMPLVGAVLAALLLNEALEGHHLFGMALILGGILWFSRLSGGRKA